MISSKLFFFYFIRKLKAFNCLTFLLERYGTYENNGISVTNNVSGIWNLTDIKNGNFAIHSSGANKPLKNSWLVSNLFVANACSPDKGLTVKNMSQSTNSYKYTYTKPGKYTATFIGTNSNYKHESRVIRELTINVTE